MIYVTGDLIIDEYLYGTTTRISPEAPVPIVDLSSRERRWGGSGNVFKNIQSVYSAARFRCYVSARHQDLFPIDENISYVACPKIPTKTRVISNGRYMSRIDDEEYISIDDLESTMFTDWDSMSSEAHVVLSDYNKGSIKNPQQFIQQCNGKVLVDPKLSLDMYKGAYLIKPNRKEFEDYVGKCNTPKELMVKAQLTRDHLDVTYLVVTLGEDGVLLVGDTIEHYESQVEEVFDVTGAGDTFMAGLALGLELKLSISESTRLANTLAGIAVSHSDTYIITPEDWAKALEELA